MSKLIKNKHVFVKGFLLAVFVAVLASCASIPSTGEKGVKILTSTPWVTTAVYKQVDGIANKEKNYINDPVAQGTVSSARYGVDQFVFVPLDTQSGEFDLSDVSALITNTGKYELNNDEKGNLVRRVYDTAFGYTHTRIITHLSANEFTYTFDKDGSTYYVEHRPYAKAYPGIDYPEELKTAIDALFQGM